MSTDPDKARDEGRSPDSLLTVTALAEMLGVTPRAIRFYETKGLISPARAGANRVYGRRDQVRMKLILRGKRLGFSLRDIKTFLDLYDADPTGRIQMQQLLASIRQRRMELEEQQSALTETLKELEVLEDQAREALANTKEMQPRKAAP